MMNGALYRLSIPFALVTGTGAGLLAVVLWEMLRDSPFGTALKLLALVMTIATVYHGGLLVTGSETLVLESLLLIEYVLVSIALFAIVSELSGDSWREQALRHQNVFLAAILGLLLYAIGGPLSEVFFPPMLHWVHGFAALFAIAGMYSPIHNDLRKQPWNELLLEDATDGRRHADWMVPMDDVILELLSSGLILTPAVIACNAGYSRSEVNRRLTKLKSESLVERVDRGKYRLTVHGERYLEGEAPTPA